MHVNRRELLASAAMSASAAAALAAPDFSAVRRDFPRARTAAYFDNASCHPLSVHTAAALHRYVDWATNEVGDPWWPSWTNPRSEAKNLFAKLINAKPNEIAFARSTIEAESNLLNGMDIQSSGGNVVTNDLHYTAAIHNYKMRQQAGLDVRVVKHRDWQIDMRDMERAVNNKTRLIAVALVSNVNGYLQPIKQISELAHAHGAYVYADIIQCAGAIPIDVKAMGIDFAACSTYKWLMGCKGFGFVYMREDLQIKVVKPTHDHGGVQYNYAPWTMRPDPNREEIIAGHGDGPARYEVSYPAYEGAICALESLKYIHRLGVNNIRAHARSLTDRLHKELPALGCPSITPKDNESPIVAFAVKDPKKVMEDMKKADVWVAMRFGNKMRIAPSVYNSHQDVDRLLAALA
ncbi:MAG: aminotransferase class V-fold PLP-dependent enzyme [Bryobacterales bacterium]|nr:aminotransferase class V-fold PLP-dependent enzyme [Bryobacterales bacterium]